jgi:hypothetical protein
VALAAPNTLLVFRITSHVSFTLPYSTSYLAMVASHPCGSLRHVADGVQAEVPVKGTVLDGRRQDDLAGKTIDLVGDLDVGS